MDKYSTHLPVLASLLIHYPKHRRVLEIGAGDYSSPLLSLSAKMGDIEVVSVESSYKWIDSLRHLEHEDFRFEHRDCLADIRDFLNLQDLSWDMVFIDSDPEADRKSVLELVRPHGKIFVLHDTQNEHIYGDYLSSFKYSFEYRGGFPMTTVVSDIVDLSLL